MNNESALDGGFFKGFTKYLPAGRQANRYEYTNKFVFCQP